MIPFLYLALLPGAPAATPPPVITRVKSSPFCTALRQNVGRALPGLALDDKLIGMSIPAIAKLSHDTVIGSHVASAANDRIRPAVRLDYNRMNEIGGALTHNLDILDKLIRGPRFTAPVGDPDAAPLAKMQRQLSRIEVAQRTALNVLMALSDTGQMENLQNMKNPLGAMIGPSGKSQQDASFAGGPLGDAPGDGVNAQKQIEDEHFLTAGPYVDVFNALREVQAGLPPLESSLAQTVIGGAQSCR